MAHSSDGRPYKYDVAISFLAQDEPLAVQLADALRDRMTVFVYSEQQKELVGKDGLEEGQRSSPKCFELNRACAWF